VLVTRPWNLSQILALLGMRMPPEECCAQKVPQRDCVRRTPEEDDAPGKSHGNYVDCLAPFHVPLRKYQRKRGAVL